MSVYENNMSALKEHRPQIYDAIVQKEDDTEEDRTFFVEMAKNGMPVLCMEQEEEIIYLNSRYDPQREAERYVMQFEHIFDYSVMFFFGLGNGLVAKKMIEDRGEHIEYIFYEPSIQLFKLALEWFDLSVLFAYPRFTLIVRGLNDERIDGIVAGKITIQNYKIAFYHSLPLYGQLFDEIRKETAQKFSDAVTWVGINVGTFARFNKLLAVNEILNMGRVFDCNCEEQFNGVFPVDRPAIIVAAGPSLEKNVEFLKLAKGKMLILATDSALPYLCKKGIVPDMVVTVDASKPVGLFGQEEVRELPLAVIAAANHAIVDRMKGKIIFFSADCDYYSKLFQMAGNGLYSLPSGGNVATSAFHMAIAWGYRRIVLIGQDLAVTLDKMHAGEVDTVLLTANTSRPLLEVEGYYGEKVYTLPDFDSYRKYYERIIRNDEDLEVINATEGGARIEGATQMTLREVIEECDAEPFDFETTIKEMPPVFKPEQRDEVIRVWEESVQNLDTIKSSLHDGIQLLNRGLKLLDTGHYTAMQMEELQKEIQNIVKECDAMSEIFFLDEMVMEDQADVLGDIYAAKKDSTEEVRRIFEKMLKYIQAMHEAADEVKGLFGKIIEEGRSGE